MKITTNNVKVSEEIKYTPCKVIKPALLLQPADARRFSGSLNLCKSLRIGITQTEGTVDVISIEKDDIDNKEWCLIRYPAKTNNAGDIEYTYYYTLAECINTDGFVDKNTPIMVDDPKPQQTTFANLRRTTVRTASTGAERITTYPSNLLESNRHNISNCKMVAFNRSTPASEFKAYGMPDANSVVNPDGIGPAISSLKTYQDIGSGSTYLQPFYIQSKWKGIDGKYYYCTAVFGNTVYIPEEYIIFISPSSQNIGYTMVIEDTPLWELYSSSKATTEMLNKGDVFQYTGRRYTSISNYQPFGPYIEADTKKVLTVKPDSAYTTPYSGDPAVFDSKWLGSMLNYSELTNNTSVITASSLWPLSDINLARFKLTIKTDINNNSFMQLNNAVPAGKNLVTVNKIIYGDKSYWICGIVEDKYKWYLIEDSEEIRWSKNVQNQNSFNQSTIINDQPTQTVPNISIPAVVPEMPVVTTKINNNDTHKDTWPTVEEKKTQTPSLKEPYKEPEYDINISVSKDPWTITGVDLNGPTIDPDYDGWVHLHNAMAYELKTQENRYDDRHMRLINRFKFNTLDEGLSTKSFIFMTRPDLNLYKETYPDPKNPNHSVIDGNSMNPDLFRLPGFKYIGRMKNACRSIMASLEYYGTNTINTPWLSIIHNQARGYSPIDRDIDFTEMGETFHGNKIIYAEPTFKHKIAGTVQIPFKERRDLSLYYTLKMWVEYIQAVSLGFCSPRRCHITNHELDYAVSLYYITTDETMENILYWEKLIGVIPLSVPESFFSWEKGTPERNMEYTINFAYSMRIVQDELHLCEINNLYTNNDERKGSMATYMDYNYVYDESYNNIMTKIASSYGILDPKLTDSDLAKKAIDKEAMKQFYYANKIRQSGYTNGGNAKQGAGNGYGVLAQNSNGNIQQINANFLPNYIPELGMHGIPYVKGPFITREYDTYDANGSPIDNGIYKLRWV